MLGERGVHKGTGRARGTRAGSLRPQASVIIITVMIAASAEIDPVAAVPKIGAARAVAKFIPGVK